MDIGMHTTVDVLDPSYDVNCLPDLGGYRVKEERAQRIIELVKDAFLRQHTSAAHLEEPPPHFWSFSAALERVRMCCTSDPHSQERRRIQSDIQDLKRRRAVAAKLLDEVEQEVEVIQTCLQERLQRCTALERSSLPRSCWRIEQTDEAATQGGGFELRRALRSKLDNTLAAVKSRDEELRKVYTALRGRDEELARMRQQEFASSASPSVRGGMQKYFRGGKVQPLSRAFHKVERASLHIVLVMWQQHFRQCCFVERVCSLLTKVLEASSQGIAGVDALIQKLRFLRNQVPPAESWELLNALDWAVGSMTHSPTSVQQPLMLTDIGGAQGPWYTGLKGGGRRGDRSSVERQLLNRFFATSMGRNQRASLRTCCTGWKLYTRQHRRANRILMRTGKSWAQGSDKGSLAIVFTSWHQEIHRSKRVLHEELIAGMRTRQNELERLLSGGHGGALDSTRNGVRGDVWRDAGSSRSPAKATTMSGPAGPRSLSGAAGSRSHVVSLGDSVAGPAGPKAAHHGAIASMAGFAGSSQERGIAPDMVSNHRGSGARHAIRVVMESARGLRKADWMGKSDPYCVCAIPGQPESKVQTPFLESTLNPVWNHACIIKDYAEGDSLEFSVWDRDPPPKKDDLLGRVILNSTQIMSGFSGELQLLEAGRGIQAFLRVTVALADRDSSVAPGSTEQDAAAWFAGATNLGTQQGFSGPFGQGAAVQRPGPGLFSREADSPPARTAPAMSRDMIGSDDRFIPGIDGDWGAPASDDNFFIAPPPADSPRGDNEVDHSTFNPGRNPTNARKGGPRPTPKSRPPATTQPMRSDQNRSQRPTDTSELHQAVTKAPAAPPKAKSANRGAAGGAGQTYTVFLDRATDDTLGIEVQHDTERQVIVITNVTGGLAGRWNNENPENQIQPGDNLLEVNGVQRPVQALLERCRLDEVLMMTLGR